MVELMGFSYSDSVESRAGGQRGSVICVEKLKRWVFDKSAPANLKMREAGRAREAEG
jgi:hypothetical protein